VGGTGGPTKFDATGNTLDSNGDPGRVYMYDTSSATDLADGVSNRTGGVGSFAMMIWDFGGARSFVRVYPMQDHLTPNGPQVDSFGGADVVEWSLWGSNNGDDFVLLSDVTGQITGGMSPTYTFVGPSTPTTVYRGAN